jgi:DNA-binding transcriptional ArsR family regulator
VPGNGYPDSLLTTSGWTDDTSSHQHRWTPSGSRQARWVGDIVQATGLAQPNVSAQLACLWDCGLVAAGATAAVAATALSPGD